MKLKLFENQIQNKKMIKILRVIFDEKIKWLLHFKKLKIQTSNRLNLLSHATWRAYTRILMQIYKSLILSKLDY